MKKKFLLGLIGDMITNENKHLDTFESPIIHYPIFNVKNSTMYSKRKQEIVFAKEWFLVELFIVKVLITLKIVPKWIPMVRFLVHLNLLSPFKSSILTLHPIYFIHKFGCKHSIMSKPAPLSHNVFKNIFSICFKTSSLKYFQKNCNVNFTIMLKNY